MPKMTFGRVLVSLFLVPTIFGVVIYWCFLAAMDRQDAALRFQLNPDEFRADLAAKAAAKARERKLAIMFLPFAVGLFLIAAILANVGHH